jgi:DNA polymerase III, epsilon subunit and related 3''-5'' exonucleases
MTDPMPICSTDTETTGRNPSRHMAWEVAVVRREADGTESRRLWQIRPTAADLRAAEDEALDISMFRERFAVPDGAQAADMTPTLTGGAPSPLTYAKAAAEIWTTLHRVVLIGSNAHFDASFLHALFDRHMPSDPDRLDPWHYRPVCAVTLAAGRLRALGGFWEAPYSTTELTNALGVPRPPAGQQHTALADADWALALYDAATAPTPALRRCLFPGCLREFDIVAHMSGHQPATPSWSGKGWVHMRPTILTGYACPDHAQAIREHRVTWQHDKDWTTKSLTCSCGWSSPTTRWRGVPEASWQDHLLETIGVPA